MAKVLVIDSDTEGAQGLQAALEAQNIETQMVADGNEGLTVVKNFAPNVIVLCVELNRVSGYSICNKLKKDPALSNIPLILTSSQATDETFEQHKKLKTRAEGYLKKPYELNQLLALLAEYVPVRAVGSRQAAKPAVKASDFDLTELGNEDTAVPGQAHRQPGVAPSRPARPGQRSTPSVELDLDADLAIPVAPTPRSSARSNEPSASSARSRDVSGEAPRGSATHDLLSRSRTADLDLDNLTSGRSRSAEPSDASGSGGRSRSAEPSDVSGGGGRSRSADTTYDNSNSGRSRAGEPESARRGRQEPEGRGKSSEFDLDDMLSPPVRKSAELNPDELSPPPAPSRVRPAAPVDTTFDNSPPVRGKSTEVAMDAPRRPEANRARSGEVSVADARVSESQSDQLRQEVRQLRQKVQQLEQALEQKELEFNDRLLEESTRGRDSVELKKKVASLERDITRYQQAMEKAREETEQAMQAAEQARQNETAFDDERQALTEKIASLVDKVKALAAEHQDMQRELNEARQTQQNLAGDLENSQKARQKAKKAVDIAVQLLEETGLIHAS